jgi:hypothetical protein
VGKEHGGRIAVPYLQRMNEDISLEAVEINKELGCFPDPGYGPVIMAVSQYGEIGNRVQLEEIGAGYAEKLPIIRSVAQADRRSDRQSKT